MENYQWGGGGGKWGKSTGTMKHNWQVQNKQGEVKNSVGNGEAKKLICTIYGHELRDGGMLERTGVPGEGG